MNLYFDNLKSNNLKSSNINQDLYITNFLTRFDLMAKYIYLLLIGNQQCLLLLMRSTVMHDTFLEPYMFQS